ncbi:MAG: hypothetical protein ACM3W4_02260 [Ignavibacteriales bacterium]
MLKTIIAAAVAAAVLNPAFAPIRLHAGENPVPNIAGDGRSGSISLDWRENGNAWGYDIYTVKVGSSVASVEGEDRFTDSPHTGDDMIKSVRFARGGYGGRSTTFALVANREIVDGVTSPARTTIKIYALRKNPDALGTPYEFVKVQELTARHYYCNADMALRAELGFPLARTYNGPLSFDGC